MPGLIELGSADAVRDFISQNSGGCIVTFSAHWCGPCKASKPALEQLAVSSDPKKIAIVYESDIGDAIHSYGVRAFPTYILFVGSQEKRRVEGANLAKVQEMLAEISALPLTGGETLGGGAGGASGLLSPAEARAARLARLGASPAAAEPAVVDSGAKEEEEQANKEETAKPSESPAKTDKDGDTEMKEEEEAEAKPEDPVAKLDPASIQTLTESMGFSLIRAQKGLLYGVGGTVEGAVEWLMQHQDDDDIDEPIKPETMKAQSYKCNDCGRILSSMANLELHANKTGHSDFEESTEQVKPLTEEEKAAKIAEIKVCFVLSRVR